MVNNLDFACTACFAWLAFSIYNRGSGGVDPGLLILFPVVTARMGCNGLKNFSKGKRDWEMWKKEELVQEKQAKWGRALSMKKSRKSTLQVTVRLNGRVIWPSVHRLANWACKPRLWLGLSTDAFLKPLKKFLDKEVRLIRRSGSFPHHFTMSGSQIHLFFCNRLPDYPAGRILDNIGALQKY